MRDAIINRKTNETEIDIYLNIDGTGKNEIDTGIGFFDHLLILFCSYAKFDIKLKAKGDLYVDCHHTVEDIGICLGEVLKNALKEKSYINRYGFFLLPMDETLVLSSLDLCNRSYLNFDASFTSENIGEMPTELFIEFFRAFTNHANFTLHIKNLSNNFNNHHLAEAIFKSVGKSLLLATSIDKTNSLVPSTKGVI